MILCGHIPKLWVHFMLLERWYHRRWIKYGNFFMPCMAWTIHQNSFY